MCSFCGKKNEPRRIPAPDWMSREFIYYPVQFCSCEQGQRLRREFEDASTQKEWLKRAKEIIKPIEKKRWGKYRFSSWERFRAGGDAARWQDAIEKYADHVKNTGANWLFVHGNNGTGKTHLSVAATRKIAANNLWKPAIVVWVELCTTTKEGWSSKDFNERAAWQPARDAGILLIDDLDKIPSEKWAMGKLLALLNHRSDNQMPTIITANHSIEELETRWGNDDIWRAVLSRIGGQLSAVIEMNGEDSRWA